MFGFLKEKDTSLPIVKSGSKRLDNRVSNALKASSGKCIHCKKHYRYSKALFCKKCLRPGGMR